LRTGPSNQNNNETHSGEADRGKKLEEGRG
jgi:hypothetical protein